jgi:hypothetical protein
MLLQATRSPAFNDFTSEPTAVIVPALALVNINEVHTRSRDFHHRFVGFGLRDGQIHKLQNVRPAALLDLDGFHV